MKRKDISTRAEINERREGNLNDMEKKEVNLDRIASDLEIARRTISQLDFKGTKEGAEQLERAIEKAEDVTEDVFNKEDEELERIQSDNLEFEGEIQDSRNFSESDLQKVSDASTSIETKETVDALVDAKDMILRDIDFLDEQIRRAKDAREKSDAVRERHKARKQKGRRK